LRKAADPEKAAAFKAVFDTFRKEAVKRKAAARRGKTKAAADDFKNWLFMQQAEADRLMETLNPKVD
jgi:hypothetical protein